MVHKAHKMDPAQDQMRSGLQIPRDPAEVYWPFTKKVMAQSYDSCADGCVKSIHMTIVSQWDSRKNTNN